MTTCNKFIKIKGMKLSCDVQDKHKVHQTSVRVPKYVEASREERLDGITYPKQEGLALINMEWE